MKTRTYKNPLVLAIPRGGIVIGAALAEELHAELDIVVSRKLRAPMQPELAVGAVSEEGAVHMNMNAFARLALGIDEEYLAAEKHFQMAEIARRTKLFRQVRPRAEIKGRWVIVTDDGIATGATMIASLQILRAESPYELLAAVPVASPERLPEIRRWCDHVICLPPLGTFMRLGSFTKTFNRFKTKKW